MEVMWSFFIVAIQINHSIFSPKLKAPLMIFQHLLVAGSCDKLHFKNFSSALWVCDSKCTFHCVEQNLPTWVFAFCCAWQFLAMEFKPSGWIIFHCCQQKVRVREFSLSHGKVNNSTHSQTHGFQVSSEMWRKHGCRQIKLQEVNWIFMPTFHFRSFAKISADVEAVLGSRGSSFVVNGGRFWGHGGSQFIFRIVMQCARQWNSQFTPLCRHVSNL